MAIAARTVGRAAARDETEARRPIRVDRGKGPFYDPALAASLIRRPKGTPSRDQRLNDVRRAWLPGEGMFPIPEHGWKARMTALCSFAREGSAAIPTLTAALEDPDAIVRAVAAQALGLVGDKSVIGKLDRLLAGDPAYEVRVYAAHSRSMLGGLERGPVVNWLLRFDRLGSFRAQLQYALDRGGRPASEEVRRAYASYDTHVMGSAQIGRPAPDFELKDANGRKIRLSDYRGRKDVAVIFIYGAACMYCRGMTANLVVDIDRIESAGLQVLVVESHEPYRVRETIEETHLKADDMPIPLMADPASTVAATYGVAFQMNDMIEWGDRPSVFLVNRAGTLRFRYLARTFDDRLDADALLAEQAKLHRSEASPPHLTNPEPSVGVGLSGGWRKRIGWPAFGLVCYHPTPMTRPRGPTP